MRTRYSALNGFFTSDVGYANEAVGIWQYEDWAHRSSVKDSVAADTDLQCELIEPQTQMLVAQDSLTMHAFPWYKVQSPSVSASGGVYELRCYTAKPGAIPLWAEAFQSGLSERIQYSKPVGIWFSEVGPLNAIVHLWYYECMDHRAAVRAQALTNETWVNTVKATMPFLDTMSSKVLAPAECSPWK